MSSESIGKGEGSGANAQDGAQSGLGFLEALIGLTAKKKEAWRLVGTLDGDLVLARGDRAALIVVEPNGLLSREEIAKDLERAKIPGDGNGSGDVWGTRQYFLGRSIESMVESYLAKRDGAELAPDSTEGLGVAIRGYLAARTAHLKDLAEKEKRAAAAREAQERDERLRVKPAEGAETARPVPGSEA